MLAMLIDDSDLVPSDQRMVKLGKIYKVTKHGESDHFICHTKYGKTGLYKHRFKVLGTIEEFLEETDF
jgi:hypothetical protein